MTPVSARHRSASDTGSAAEPLVASRSARAEVAHRARVASSAASNTANSRWYMVGTAIIIVADASSSQNRVASNFGSIRADAPATSTVVSEMPRPCR